MRISAATATRVRLGIATASLPSCSPPRAKPEKEAGIAEPNIVLPPEMPEGEAAEHRQRAKRRDERQDADIGHQKAVARPPASPTASAAGTANQGEPPATNDQAATIPARLAIEPTLRSKSPIAITIVIVEETTASMLICCEMLKRLREVTKVSGRFDPEEDENDDEADQGAVAGAQGYAWQLMPASRRSRARAGAAGVRPCVGSDRRPRAPCA